MSFSLFVMLISGELQALLTGITQHNGNTTTIVGRKTLEAAEILQQKHESPSSGREYQLLIV